MDITIEQLQATDAKKLFEFELVNRVFFEKMVPTRGDDYYHFDSFQERHEALLDEQAKGNSLFYLIKDQNGSIIGRINLVDIDKVQGVAHIGYRIGEIYTGKGIAVKALTLLLENVTKMNISKLLAQTTTTNIASQKILEKNGFIHVKLSDEEFEMNGQKFKFTYYQWTNS